MRRIRSDWQRRRAVLYLHKNHLAAKAEHPMTELHKNLVTDDRNRPVAVQIDYADWVALEERLSGLDAKVPHTSDLACHSGRVRVSIEPLEFQARIRGEWQ